MKQILKILLKISKHDSCIRFKNIQVKFKYVVYINNGVLFEKYYFHIQIKNSPNSFQRTRARSHCSNISRYIKPFEQKCPPEDTFAKGSLMG